MNNLQKILSKEKGNSCNPNREAMILDYVLTMLGRGDSLDTINEVARFLRNFEIEKVDNPLTASLLESYWFIHRKGTNEFVIGINDYEIKVSLGNTIQQTYLIIMKKNNDSYDTELKFTDYLATEKQLLNLIQTLFGVTLTKKQ